MTRQISIQVLSENSAGRGKFIAEHGLAYLLECNGEKILFDTGQGLTLEHNMRVLGVDMREIKKVVISHGHYDHTGGLMVFAENSGGAEVFAHSDIFTKRYAVKDKDRRVVGIPFERQDLEGKGLKFVFDRKPREISSGLMSAGEVERFTEIPPHNFVRESENGEEPDPFWDDQFMLASTPWGDVLILGCTHSGLGNALLHAQKMNGGKKIRMVLGGMHLIDMGDAEVKKNIELLKEMEVEYAAPMHCSGFPARCMAREMFGKKYLELKVGTKMTFSEDGLLVS